MCVICGLRVCASACHTNVAYTPFRSPPPVKKYSTGGDCYPIRFLGGGWGGGGGKTYHVNFFGGGEARTAECALQNHFWRPQKLGLVWSAPLSLKGNDRESPKRRGGNLS